MASENTTVPTLNNHHEKSPFVSPRDLEESETTDSVNIPTTTEAEHLIDIFWSDEDEESSSTLGLAEVECNDPEAQVNLESVSTSPPPLRSEIVKSVELKNILSTVKKSNSQEDVSQEPETQNKSEKNTMNNSSADPVAVPVRTIEEQMKSNLKPASTKVPYENNDEPENNATLCAINFVDYHGMQHLQTYETDIELKKLYYGTRNIFLANFSGVVRGFGAVLYAMRVKLKLLHTRRTQLVEHTKYGQTPVKRLIWNPDNDNGPCAGFVKEKKKRALDEINSHYAETGYVPRGYNNDYQYPNHKRPTQPGVHFREQPYKVVREKDGREIYYYSREPPNDYSHYHAERKPEPYLRGYEFNVRRNYEEDNFSRVMMNTGYRSPPAKPRFERPKFTAQRNKDFSTVRSQRPPRTVSSSSSTNRRRPIHSSRFHARGGYRRSHSSSSRGRRDYKSTSFKQSSTY